MLTRQLFDYDIDGDLDMFLLNQAMHTPNAYRPGQIRETKKKCQVIYCLKMKMENSLM